MTYLDKLEHEYRSYLRSHSIPTDPALRTTAQTQESRMKFWALQSQAILELQVVQAEVEAY